MNNLFPNSAGILNKGERETKAFLRALRDDLQHLQFIAASRKLHMASQRVASQVPPSLRKYLNGLANNLSRGQLSSSMSVPAFDAAVAQATAIVANARAREANRVSREQQEVANRARRNAEAAARQQNAQRRAAANRVRRQAEANSRAAERIAEQRAREAAEAKRAANEAREAKRRENEVRAATAEKARFEKGRRPNNGGAASKHAERAAARQANLKARVNAATQRARQATRARQAGETPGVVRRPGAATPANFNALRVVPFTTKNQFNAFLKSIKNGGGRSAHLRAKVKYAPVTSNNAWAVEKINRAWSQFYG
jgi:flagellar biosynthesis GTPase FlhF